jgi:torulene dioxygenase
MLEGVRKTGSLDGITFGKKRDLCESFFKKVTSMFKSAASPQNVGVTVSVNMPGGGYLEQKRTPALNGHSNEVKTLHLKTDASVLNQIDPETLEPKGVCRQNSLHPSLVGELSAAHASTDPATGDIFNYNLEMGRKATYRVFRTSSTGQTEILATFNGNPAYLHSFFLTEHYVVLCIWNSHISWSGLSILYHKNIIDAIAPFDPSSKAKWYLVGRAGQGLVATYESDPFFCFHTINAWEQPSSDDDMKTDIICELSLYENLDVVHRFYYDNLMSTNEASKAYAGQKRLSSLPRHVQFRLPGVNLKI